MITAGLKLWKKDSVIVESYGYTNLPYGTCTERTNTRRGIWGIPVSTLNRHTIIRCIIVSNKRIKLHGEVVEFWAVCLLENFSIH